MPDSESLRLSSPAKINVFLEVLGKRADGFHELETVMLRTDLCDVMTFTEDHGGQLSLELATGTAPELRDVFPLDASNLILKAAQALRESVGQSPGARIIVDKQIPAEAGLAGGSSNAATTLLGLNQLWGLRLPSTELHQIAATLGSDINFFLEDCTAAICRGRGERVTPIPVGGELHFVAARTTTGNSTPEIFANLTLSDEKKTCANVVAALKDGSSGRLTESAFNRLTSAGRVTNTEMVELMNLMKTVCGRPVFMSGSGSTCFVVCHSRADSQEVIERCQPIGAAFLTSLKTV